MRNAFVAYRNHENGLLFRNRIPLHFIIDKLLFISDKFKLIKNILQKKAIEIITLRVYCAHPHIRVEAAK